LITNLLTLDVAAMQNFLDNNNPNDIKCIINITVKTLLVCLIQKENKRFVNVSLCKRNNTIYRKTQQVKKNKDLTKTFPNE